jgi:LysM repeat protein
MELVEDAASRAQGFCRVLVPLALTLLLAPRPSYAQEATDPADGARDTTLRYEIRPGDDPARVARIFQVPVAELLQRNGIRDPSHLKVGAVLEIPDSRAVLVRDLRTRQGQLDATVAELRRTVADEQARSSRAEDELRATSADRDALARRVLLYRTGTIAAGVASCAALALALALVAALARLRAEVARRASTVKHAESLRAAVDRYRILGARLELKYQSLYREAAAEVSTRSAAEALRDAYDDERTALEAEIARSAAALAAEDKPAPRRKHHKAA